jgi:hypothetical protein
MILFCCWFNPLSVVLVWHSSITKAYMNTKMQMMKLYMLTLNFINSNF